MFLWSLLNYVPFVPTCLTCLCALRALNYYVPMCLRAINYYVPTYLRALNYNVLRALIFYVLTRLQPFTKYIEAHFYTLHCCFSLDYLQKQPPEVFFQNRCSLKFRKIHRKTLAPECLFWWSCRSDYIVFFIILKFCDIHKIRFSSTPLEKENVIFS